MFGAGRVTPTVLILSCPQDLHAHAVCEAIERKGSRALILYTTDFPSRAGLTVIPEDRRKVASRRQLRFGLGPPYLLRHDARGVR